MIDLARRLLRLSCALTTRPYRAAELSKHPYRCAAHSSHPSFKPAVEKKRRVKVVDENFSKPEGSGSTRDFQSSPNRTVSGNPDSTNVPIADQFGLLAAACDSTRPAVHKSLEGRSTPADGWKASDSALLDPLDEPESIRRTIRLRTQRPDARLTWNARQIALQSAGGNVDAALKAFFDGALDTDRVIPPRYLVHRLLGALAECGRSSDAFHVYRKMKEIGMSPTQATYSRLFRACAEDCAVWYRENEHLFPSSSTNGPFLTAFQRRRNQLLEKALCTDRLVSEFGGPALPRAQGLWKKLRSDNVPLSAVTVNALLFALAKGGDLTGCFQVVDAMLSRPVSHHASSKKAKEPLFQPDSYTVTALLSAVRPASLKRHLLATTTTTVNSPPASDAATVSHTDPSPMTAFELSLTVWHRLLPYMASANWGPQCFVSLVHSIRVDFAGSRRTGDHLLLFHPKLGLQTIKPNTNGSDPLQRKLLSNASQITDAKAETNTVQSSQISDLVNAEAIVIKSDDVQSLLGLDRPVRVFRPNWDDVQQLSIQSPVNLLLPLDHAVLIVPPTRGWLPWHRLALIGGLNGFLDCVKQQYNSTVTVQLLTALLGLIPAPERAQSIEDLDIWERQLLDAAKQNDVRLDMGFFNALIDRRTRAGQSGALLLAEAVRIGLVPDQITWGSLARGCKTVACVEKLLHGFAQASQSKDLRSIRPSQAFLASILTASPFNWDVKTYVLRLMSGEEVDGDEHRGSEFTNESANPLARTTTTTTTTGDQDRPFRGIEPDRRLIADLEIHIAFFRELLRKGLIPQDGSAVPASPETEGVSIPRYAASAFQRFLPVYRKWLATRCGDHRL